jgi:hypothetical protein
MAQLLLHGFCPIEIPDVPIDSGFQTFVKISLGLPLKIEAGQVRVDMVSYIVAKPVLNEFDE